MEKCERLRKAFDYLRYNGLAHTQLDVANAMGSSASNVSSAFSGKENSLTDKFMRRFNRAFGSLFNESWLLLGEGEMLRPAGTQVGDGGNNQQGSNNNNQQGDGNSYNSSEALCKALDNIKRTSDLVKEAHDLIKEQQALTRNAQSQTDKAHEQIDRLLSLLEKMHYENS